MSSVESKTELEALISTQGQRVRELKAQQAASALIDAEVAKLKELKSQLPAVETKPANGKVDGVVASKMGGAKVGGKSKKAKGKEIELKCPKVRLDGQAKKFHASFNSAASRVRKITTLMRCACEIGYSIP